MALTFTVTVPDESMSKIVEYMGYDGDEILSSSEFCDALGAAFSSMITERLVDEPHYAAEDAISANPGLAPNGNN